MTDGVPGPVDIPAAARAKAAALLPDLERDRAALAAAGEAGGVAAYDRLIDAVRRLLEDPARPGGPPPRG